MEYYVDTMVRMEKGLTPEIFKRFMDLASKAEGEGNRTGIIERMRQAFGLNYTNARELYDNRGKLSGMTPDQLDAELAKYRNNLPNASSPELDVAKAIQETVNNYTIAGQRYWDGNIQNILDELRKSRFIAGGGELPDTTGMSAEEAEEATRQAYADARDSGDRDITDAAREAWYQADREKKQYEEELRKFNSRMFIITDDYFSPGGRSAAAQADKAAIDSIGGTLTSAAQSYDPEQLRQAVEFISLLESVDKKDRKTWDKENTLNSLAGKSLDEMISLLKQLLKIEEQILEEEKKDVIIEER